MLPKLLPSHLLVAIAASDLHVGTDEAQVMVEVTHGVVYLVAILTSAIGFTVPFEMLSQLSNGHLLSILCVSKT